MSLGDPQRRLAIIRLLATMDDGLPEPAGQWASFGALPGEKATKRQPCRSCDTSGRVNTRTGDEPCAKCDGAGWFLVDAYTGRRENEPVAAGQALGALSGPAREEWRKRTDETIRRIRSQLVRPTSSRDEIEEANQTPEPWERARKRMFKRYDYGALNRALDALRCGNHACQRAAAAVRSVYTHGHTEPSTTLERDAELGLFLLDRLMPDPIRAPGVETVEHPAVARIRRRAA